MEYSRINAPLTIGDSPTEPAWPFTLLGDGEARGAPAMQAALDALPIAAAIAMLDEDAPRLIASNARFARLLASPRGREHMAALREPLEWHMRGGCAPETFTWVEPGIGGRHFEVHLSALGASPRRIARTMLTLIDRTAAVETERSLRNEMLRDSLTGLPNRLAFTEAVDAQVAQLLDERGSFAVLTVDLVRFSRINESIGSIAGDELIITVASRLKAAMRPGDLLARLSGDEFAVLAPIADGPGDALHVARRLQEALSAPIRLAEYEIRIDCAIGCAHWIDASSSTADVMRNAQFALKRAKRSGRIEIYQPGEAGRAHRRFSLETELRRAIDTDQMSLAFQPLIDLGCNRVIGFEALARWEHPDRGPISPAEFIPVAEESGLIVPLGRWALDRALSTMAGWDRSAGSTLPIYCSVNVSPIQLARDAMPQAVAAALDANGIGGDRLTLELTESSIVADPDRAAGTLDALHALSCRIAMDDFGTGHSSLALLQRLPIDVLKIDREFVSGMFDDRDSTAIIRAILSLAAALDMSTIAEGIETAQAARMLTALGCRTGQGYYFARPMTADAALAHLLEQGERPAR